MYINGFTDYQGTENTAVGCGALGATGAVIPGALTTLAVAVGTEAFANLIFQLPPSEGCVAVGHSAGFNLGAVLSTPDGQFNGNTLVGYQALYDANQSQCVTALGHNALYAYNGLGGPASPNVPLAFDFAPTAVGFEAMGDQGTPWLSPVYDYCTAVGNRAAFIADIIRCTAVGHAALYNGGVTDCVSVGVNAGPAINSFDSIGIGNLAGANSIMGDSINIGHYSSITPSPSSMSDDVTVGTFANSGGLSIQCVLVGSVVCPSQSMSQSVVVGAFAAGTSATNANAVAVGYAAAAGDNGVAVGDSAFCNGFTPGGIALGAAASSTNGGTALGAGAIASPASGYAIAIGPSASAAGTNTLFFPPSMATVTGLSVEYDTVTGAMGPQASTRRMKSDIQPTTLDSSAVLTLQPVDFTWTATGKRDVGLIAEDVNEVLPQIVPKDAEGLPLGIQYDKLTVFLIDVCKQQQGRLDALDALVAQQQAQINQLLNN